MPKPKKADPAQSERFKKAAREHGAEDVSDLDDVMRRLAAQKRHEEESATSKGEKPKGKKANRRDT